MIYTNVVYHCGALNGGRFYQSLFDLMANRALFVGEETDDVDCPGTGTIQG